jgi:MFS family permease
VEGHELDKSLMESGKPVIPTGTKYRALFCAMGVNLLIGSYYTYSNMYEYVNFHLKKHNPWLSDDGSDTKLVLPVWLIIQSCCAILSVRVAELIGYRTLNWIAFMAFVANNGLMIFVTDYWVYVAVYGVMNGIAIGFGYLPALYTAWTYFPDKKSLATGVILFCAGMSASIASPIVTMIVNPNKVKSNSQEVVDRVPLLFTYLTIGYGVIALVACTFQPPPFKSEISKERDELRRKLTLIANGPEKDQLQTRIRGMSVVNAFNNKITERELAAAGKEYIVRRTMFHKVGEADALMLGQMKLDQIEEIVAHTTGIINLEKGVDEIDTSGFGRGTAQWQRQERRFQGRTLSTQSRDPRICLS